MPQIGRYLHGGLKCLTSAWNMLELESDVDCCLFTFSNACALLEQCVRKKLPQPYAKSEKGECAGDIST